MAWLPISNTALQYVDTNGDPYSGAVLKFYEAGTSTNIPVSTSITGTPTVTSVALNSAGFPAVSGNVVALFIDQDFKIALYPTQAAADSNTGAIWTIDNIDPFAAFPLPTNIAAINAITPTDSVIIVGDGTTWVGESGGTALNSLGIGPTSSPTFVGVTVSSATITGLTTGHVVLANSAGALTALDVTAKGSLIVGDGAGAPTTLAVGTNNYLLTADSTQATGLRWAAPSSVSIARSARTSNTIITAANIANLIDITSGTFTQTFDSAATLGSGFFCYIKNSGTGVVTLGITLDGVASPTLRNNEYVIVQTDGTSFYTASKIASSSGASLVYLSTTTGSGVAAIDVETGFSSVYDNYVIIGVGISASDFENIRSQWKIGGAYVTTSTYITATADATVSATATTLVTASPPAAPNGGDLRYEIYNVNSAAAKTARVWATLTSSTPSIAQTRNSHFNSGTGAITGVKFLVAAGTMSGTFYLYGVRK